MVSKSKELESLLEKTQKDLSFAKTTSNQVLQDIVSKEANLFLQNPETIADALDIFVIMLKEMEAELALEKETAISKNRELEDLGQSYIYI